MMQAVTTSGSPSRPHRGHQPACRRSHFERLPYGAAAHAGGVRGRGFPDSQSMLQPAVTPAQVAAAGGLPAPRPAVLLLQSRPLPITSRRSLHCWWRRLQPGLAGCEYDAGLSLWGYITLLMPWAYIGAHHPPCDPLKRPPAPDSFDADELWRHCPPDGQPVPAAWHPVPFRLDPLLCPYRGRRPSTLRRGLATTMMRHGASGAVVVRMGQQHPARATIVGAI
jgi:hypothetical protein